MGFLLRQTHPIRCVSIITATGYDWLADQVEPRRAHGVVYVAASRGLLAWPSIAGFGCSIDCTCARCDSNNRIGFELTDALDLYLRLKGDGRDKVFVRAARRNIGYVVEARQQATRSICSLTPRCSEIG